MVQKILGAQRDFSSGEIDVALKRNDDHPARKTGLRQASNWRILSSNGIQNRPGRSAMFFESGRVEEVIMSPGNLFYLAFGAGYLRVYNAAGTRVFSSTVKGDGATLIPWTSATVKNICWTQAAGANQFSIYICYSDDAPVNVPQILTWDRQSQTSTWFLNTYAEEVAATGQKRTPFYRISPQNVTMQPSAATGSIVVVFNTPIVTAGLIGTRFEFCGSQLTITSINSSSSANAVVNQDLPSGQVLNYNAGTSSGTIAVGQEIIGATTGARGIVTSVGAGTLNCQLIPVSGTVKFFVGTENAIGPNSILPLVSVGTIVPQAVAVWADEVMNNYRGWPTSTFFDQGRLGFCNFPSAPSGIAWSAINDTADLYVGASPSNAIFELVPDKAQVLYVVPGMESSEFVFCDTVIYYIPISATSPLVPGSAAFNVLSKVGSQPNVQPRSVGQTIIYMKTGSVSVGAIQSLGAYSRPYVIDDVAEVHSHLFANSTAIAIAAPPSSNQFSEDYIYILLADGSLVVGKYSTKSGIINTGESGRPQIGWLPWTGVGTVSYVAAIQTDVILTTAYPGNVSIVERLDDTQYLDGAISVNNLPVPFTPPAGKGPLWWLANGSVFLIDQGTRPMGIYRIDANGNIIPQNNGGENLQVASLVAGQAWSSTAEPFCPDAPPTGESIGQRMFKRRVSRFAANVIHSTGFIMARLFSGPLTPTSPALGATMNFTRFPAWNQGDDPTKPPPSREIVERTRPLGRSFDPRVAVIKDTPGPLLISEIGIEATI